MCEVSLPACIWSEVAAVSVTPGGRVSVMPAGTTRSPSNDCEVATVVFTHSVPISPTVASEV